MNKEEKMEYQKGQIKAKFYGPLEEKINVYSHAFGFLLSIAGLIALVTRAIRFGDIWQIISAFVFGLSLMTLYAASTIYHKSREPITRSRLRVFDHASIYTLIAGTYTPYMLVTLRGSTGWIIFGLIWGFAVTGIILKLFHTGRFTLISTLMYVFMGWAILFVINPLIEKLAPSGLTWLLAGGVAYTLGAGLYSIHKLKFHHAIFHIFVLAGSLCHFISIYYYVLS